MNACAGLIALFLAGQVMAGQLMVSGNENKIGLISGTSRVVTNAAPDSISLLDFASFPPAVTHLEGVANSVIGPPSNIALTPDGRLALVASSIRIDPAHAGKWEPDNRVQILDLAVLPPKVIGQAEVGRQPSGISITRDGRLALVANRADGTLSVLRLDGRHLTPIQTVPVCAADAGLCDAAISPDGKLALASVQKSGYLSVLHIDGETVTLTDRKLSVYGQPYRCVITPDGALGLTAGQGFGNGPDADALSVVDLEAKPMRTIDHVVLGSGPESIEVSPDGRLVAAVLMNQSNLAPDDPNLTDHGLVVLLARRGRTFIRVQEVPTGRIPEGVAFTPDGRYLVVQAHPARQLWIYAVEGEQLQDTGQRIPTPGMPSSLRAAPASSK